MKKSKERLDAERNHPMNPRQKLDNFWFYYKTHITVGLAAVIVLAVFIRDMTRVVPNDCQIGIMTPQHVSQELLDSLQQAVTPYGQDLNGDGKVTVAVTHYQLVLPGESASDPSIQMAAMTRLSVDLQNCDTILFITDHPREYHQNMGELLAYNDGSMPPEGQEPDWSRIGVPLNQCKGIGEFMEQQGEGLESFVIAKRIVTPGNLGSEKVAANYEASMALFDSITNGRE